MKMMPNPTTCPCCINANVPMPAWISDTPNGVEHIVVDADGLWCCEMCGVQFRVRYVPKLDDYEQRIDEQPRVSKESAIEKAIASRLAWRYFKDHLYR